MSSNFILRAVYNRPEMLYLSIESEIEARKKLETDNYKTLFAVEHNPSPLCLDIIENYPYPKEVVTRSFRHFGWGNILEGFKQIFDATEVKYTLNIEDDCLLHDTYFRYIEEALKLLGDEQFSVINASSRNFSNGDIGIIKPTNLFEAPGCLIDANFFNKFIRPYATYNYYKNRASIIHLVNKRNGNDPRSKFSAEKNNEFAHVGWDGLANRLIDTALIEEGIKSYSPECDRQTHIGFYGQNRPGKLPFNYSNFMDRVEALRSVISDVNEMQKYDKLHTDYVSLPNLEDWSGELKLK